MPKQRFLAEVKHAHPDVAPAAAQLPKALRDALAGHGSGDLTKKELLEVLSRHLRANFVMGGVDEADRFFTDEDDVDALEVHANDFYARKGSALPIVHASAVFELPVKKLLTDDRILELGDDEDVFLIDGVNFFWELGEGLDGWLNTHQGASFGVMAAPKRKPKVAAKKR